MYVTLGVAGLERQTSGPQRLILVSGGGCGHPCDQTLVVGNMFNEEVRLNVGGHTDLLGIRYVTSLSPEIFVFV